MNLHQLRFVREVARQSLNLTAAARALYTSQPGISKSIIELEHELGIEIFTRHGKRLRAVTEQGKHVVAAAERIVREVDALKRIGHDYAQRDQGELVVAATQVYARYLLPLAIARLRARFPKVKVSVVQGSAEQVAERVRRGGADLALTTAALPDDGALVTLACAGLRPVAVVPVAHPFATRSCVDSAELAGLELVVDDEMFRQGDLFGMGGEAPEVAVRASDAEMVKNCVGLGLGVGIIAELAFDPERDVGLRALPIATAAAAQTACIALRRASCAHRALQALAELLAGERPGPHRLTERGGPAVGAVALHRPIYSAPAPAQERERARP